MGWHHQYFAKMFSIGKTRMIGLQYAEKAGWYVKPFWHNSGAWQTGGTAITISRVNTVVLMRDKKPFDQGGREPCLRQTFKSIFDLAWLWPLTICILQGQEVKDQDLWSPDPKVDRFKSCSATTCVNRHQRFICFQNIVFTFTSLLTDERENGRTDGRTDNMKT